MVQSSYTTLPVCYKQLKQEFQVFTNAVSDPQAAEQMKSGLRLCRAPANASEVFQAQSYVKFAATTATQFNYPSPVFYPIAWPLNRSCAGDSSSQFPVSAALVALWFNSSGQVPGDCFDFTNLDIKGTTGIGAAWAYQKCNEIFYSVAGGGSDLFGSFSTNSTSPTLAEREAYCSQFGPVKPAVAEMPLRFPSTSATLRTAEINRLAFINGEFDPTHGLSPTVKDASDGVSIINIARAGHCYDMNIPNPADTPEVIAARAQEMQLIKQWIASYGQ